MTAKQRNILILKLIVFIALSIAFPPVMLFVVAVFLLYFVCKMFMDPKMRKISFENQQRIVEANLQEAQKPVCCPKCQSEQVATVNQRSGFSVGKAIAGELLAGGVGTLAGFFGSNKNKIMCMKCGHTWKPQKF